eukprot:Gb_15144 [translate_table: standard]
MARVHPDLLSASHEKSKDFFHILNEEILPASYLSAQWLSQALNTILSAYSNLQKRFAHVQLQEENVSKGVNEHLDEMVKLLDLYNVASESLSRVKKYQMLICNAIRCLDGMKISNVRQALLVKAKNILANSNKETSCDIIDFDLNEDPTNVGDDDDVQEEESSIQRKQKAQPKRCEFCNAPGPWGNGDGCNTIQYDAVVIYANSNVHKASRTSWLYKVERLAKPILEHIANIDDVNKERVVTTMKLAYFTTHKGLGPPVSQFMKLVNVSDGKGKTIYDAVNTLKEKQHLSNNKLVAVSTDGASSMVGSENGFVTLLKKELPNLICIHCIAHHEALVASDA